MSRGASGIRRCRHEGRLFRAQARADFHHVGAVAPSGRRLAAALAAAVPVGGPRPRRVLEVGAGTGAVTERIAARLDIGDTLVVVERNPVFADHLRERVESEEMFRRLGTGLHVVHATVESLPPEPTFHAVISSLPFNNFTAGEVRSHLEHLTRMLVPAGRLAFFEYLWVRHARRLVAGPQERERLREVGATLAEFLRASTVPRRLIWWNLPPAVVHTILPNPAGRLPT